MTEEFDWFTRTDDESVLWSGRPRVMTIAGEVTAALLVAVGVTVYEPTFGLAAVPLAVAFAVWSYLAVTNIGYVLTDAAVYRKDGVLSEHVARVELSRVQNTDLDKGIVGTQLGYGSVNVDTAGSEGVELSIANVEGPESVRDLLLEHTKRASAGDALTGSSGDESVERALAEARKLRETAERLEARFTEGQR